MHSPPPVRREQSYGGKAPVRNIAAPYQKPSAHKNGQVTEAAKPISTLHPVSLGPDDEATSSTSSVASSSEGSIASSLMPGNVQNGPVDTHAQISETQEVDYRNYVFTPLELVADVTFDKYCGPTPESNWVVPKLLLVGAYPASIDDDETLELIAAILKEGVNKFVCLQQEYRQYGVTEEMWRSGQALRPYFEDVISIVRQKALIPYLSGHQIVDEENLSFVHFPIRDCGITDDDRVLELARGLVKDIAEGRVIYLHCWGGHGRTGTLVCIMLHLMYGLDPTESMARCQLVHDLRQCPVVVGSPQTQTQRDQVTRVIHKLMTQTSYNRRTLSGDGSMLQRESSGGRGSGSPGPGGAVQHGSPRPLQTPAQHGNSQCGSSSQQKTVLKGSNFAVSGAGVGTGGASQPNGNPWGVQVSIPASQGAAASSAAMPTAGADGGAAGGDEHGGLDGQDHAMEAEEDDEHEQSQGDLEARDSNLHFSQEAVLDAGAEQPGEGEDDDDEVGETETRMRLGSDWGDRRVEGGDEDEDEDAVGGNQGEGGARMRLGSEWGERRDEGHAIHAASTLEAFPAAPLSPLRSAAAAGSEGDMSSGAHDDRESVRPTEPPEPAPSFRVQWNGRKTSSS